MGGKRAYSAPTPGPGHSQGNMLQGQLYQGIELTTEVEGITAIHTALEKTAETEVFVSKANSRGQGMATITFTTGDAVLAKGHLKIG